MIKMGRKELLAARDARIARAQKSGVSDASLEYRAECLKEFDRRKARGQKGYAEKAALIAGTVKIAKKEE